MALFSNEKFACVRCGKKNEPLGYAPVPNELGQKVGEEVCGECWKEWLQKQNQLINHFGLDVSNPESHEYLFDQMKMFFFDEGGEVEDIDASKEGTISW